METSDQQSVQPINAQPQPPQELNPNTPSLNWIKMLLIFVGILAVVGIGVGGYYLGTKKSEIMTSNQEIKTSPTQTVTISPTTVQTPTIDPKANWKTYTNSEVPFSIQYPSSWQYKEPSDSSGKPYAVWLTGNEGSVSITWGTGFGGGNCSQNQNPQPYSIPAQGLSGCSIINADGTETWDLFKNISTTLSIKISAQAKAPHNANSNTITQLLSSFKFMK